MRSWSSRSLSSMKGIHPDLRRVLDRALIDSPLDFVVIEGLRTRERQAELVARGASRTMNSRHLTGHAADVWPIDPETGRGADGNDDRRLWALYDQIGPAIERAAAAEDVPIVWGGRWTRFRDGPHIELERNAYPAGVADAAKHRESPAQSGTMKAEAAQIAGAAGTAVTAIGYLDGPAQIVLIALAGLSILLAAYVMRERLKAWAAGWR
jgi:peptidoglycan LD-endopeptidase CwlK